jgi:phosphosulfolactate phosphohydrolase-like enzyme
MVGAGYFAELLAARLSDDGDLSDAALAVRELYNAGNPFDALMRSRVGRMMQDRNLVHEVEFAARRSVLDVVPKLAGERLVLA